MPRIAILTHPNDNFADIPYFLREIADVWKESGIGVDVVAGISRRAPADLAILHVDLTVVPPEYLAQARSYPRCLNLYTSDISKRAISRNLVSSASRWDGPVIVKSNMNCGGIKEAQLAARTARTHSAIAGPQNYTIFASLSEVPKALFADADWVVERFLSEQREGLYCLRTWVFLGDKETNSLSFSEDPIIKSRTVIRREPVDEIPNALRQMREELGFDFGKFDYGIIDGEVVLYDVNRTPYVGNFSREQFMPRIRHYAQGIHSFL